MSRASALGSNFANSAESDAARTSVHRSESHAAACSSSCSVWSTRMSDVGWRMWDVAGVGSGMARVALAAGIVAARARAVVLTAELGRLDDRGHGPHALGHELVATVRVDLVLLELGVLLVRRH